MKKSKLLLPALGMLLLSTVASVTGTVAWFSANSTVSATGMKVKAKAEDGILISNETAETLEGGAANTLNTWKETAAASHNAVAELYPTSTATGATWVHNVSNDAASQAAAGTYEVVAQKFDTASGIGHTDGSATADTTYQSETDKAYYLRNDFYIKSSSNALTSTLKIKDVTASVSGTAASLDLNKALRVLVVFNGNFASASYVYAPFYGASLSYNVAVAAGAKDSAGTAVTANPCYYTAETKVGETTYAAGDHKEVLTSTSITAIPSNAAKKVAGDGETAAIKASVYLYFEGEDVNCKSDNIKSTLDTLEVSVSFSL